MMRAYHYWGIDCVNCYTDWCVLLVAAGWCVGSNACMFGWRYAIVEEEEHIVEHFLHFLFGVVQDEEDDDTTIDFILFF
jgi:hypothetical protein